LPAALSRSMTSPIASAKKGARLKQTISPTITVSTGASSAMRA
jgi:hypothetical protein